MMSHRLFSGGGWLAVALIICLSFASDLATSANEASTADVELKTLDDHFPFDVPDTVQQWNQRASTLRHRIRVATGLWPYPSKTPLKATIHGPVQHDGFMTEKVYFESFPGHFVTGQLFRPAAGNDLAVVDGKRPGVLSPHGHGGRTMQLSDDDLQKNLKTGGEKYEGSGRNPKYARCAHLARMGCVVFMFDMLGYADSQQIGFEVAHRHAKARPEESNRSAPCLYSVDAELNLQSIMGWQTWNAIRALDFLESLDDVDPDRLAVTGGSGGGTQTILLGALDDRVSVSFPNGMVSTSMQGGCYCENANYLRIGTGNVELAALFAPKPQGMTAADDWTRDMMSDGFPELVKLYTMLGQPKHVMCRPLLQFPHNYNYVTRETMYQWMATHLSLPPESPLVETDMVPPTEAETSVWNQQHPAPTDSGVPHERRVLAWWKQTADEALKASLPPYQVDAPERSLAKFRHDFGIPWSIMLTVPQESMKQAGRDAEQTTGADWGSDANDSVGTLIYCGQGDLPDELKAWLDQGYRLVRPEFDSSQDEQPIVANGKRYAGFTFGYNPPLVVRRSGHLAHLAAGIDGPVVLAGSGRHVAWVAGAAMLAGSDVTECWLRPDGFRFAAVDDYTDAAFVPGAAKYGDLPVLVSLRAPHRLTIVDADDAVRKQVTATYRQADAMDRLTVK
ncbi:glucuronyl esterase domain-containing protein [Crateriforma conspicua]|uniref:glucuronyl esterase domain-containing protein n=1 Tax=Crateriforma conspicua TaxID=2527996 RepID=UPI0011881E57|nr:acetylxylan esterase [Crateriforma conspicua]QDV63167.1 Acetyl xylan esterase (AXE1) [Crateriforma conspicua]